MTLRALGEWRWIVEDGTGSRREFAPVTPGATEAKLVRIARLDGSEISLRYDARGMLEWVRDSAGRLIGFEHGDDGLLRRVKLPTSRDTGWYTHVEYRYDEAGDLRAVRDAAGGVHRYVCMNHLMVENTDRTGLSYYYQYDGFDAGARCVRTWGDGASFDIVFDYLRGKTVAEDPDGFTSIYELDAELRVTAIMDPHGAFERFEYDPASGQVSARVDQLGNATRYSYDERGNRVRVECPDGTCVTSRYHESLDVPVEVIDANGGAWRWDWDRWCRLRRAHDPCGEVTTYEWEGRDLRERVLPGGGRVTYEYDDASNVIAISTSEGSRTRFAYDRLGRTTKVITSRDGVRRLAYDVLGRVVGIDEPHGVRRQFEYDAEGYLIRCADGRRDVQLTYTGFHQVHERIEHGGVVRFHYDEQDHLRLIENEVGERFEIEIDACNRVVREVSFDGSVREYDRDRAGQVTRITRGSGRTTELVRDVMGRVLEVRHDDGATVRLRYRADGALLEASNATASVRYERDAVGRVLTERTVTVDGDESWVRSGYGPHGGRVRVETGDGLLQHILRNDFGDATRVELEHARWWVDFERDVDGLEVARRFASGVESRWTRDVIGRVQRRTVSVGGAGVRHERRYEWQADEILTSVFDSALGMTQYEHDRMDRLVGAHMPWGEHQVRALDLVGNLFQTPTGQDRQYGSGGRLLEDKGTTYDYDADGRCIARVEVLGQRTTYVYSSDDRLERIEQPSGQEVRFAYDALGRRLRKEVWHPLTDEPRQKRLAYEVRWRWDGSNPIRELHSEHGCTDWVFEPETYNPLAKLAGGRIWGTLTDYNGNPTELVGTDGQVAYRQQIDAFGAAMKDVAETDCPFRWPGQYEDVETGLYYNRHRYYDPAPQRYLTPDPLGLEAGLRAYGYPLDPLVEIDPLGLMAGGHGDPGLDAFVERLRAAGINVTQTNVTIHGPGGTGPLGEIDVVTANALIQYKNGPSSAHAVIRQVQTRTEPHVTRPVVAFVEDAGRAGDRTVAGANRHGVLATNNFETLVEIIR